MALSKSGLKGRIITELSAQGFNVSENGKDGQLWIQKFAQAVANAVVDEIQANAQCSGVDSRGDAHDAVKII